VKNDHNFFGNCNSLLAGLDCSEERRTPDEVFSIFGSGAAAGYLNGEYYPNPPDASYSETFNEIIHDEFRHQAGSDGMVDLVFYRIYLLAVKE
jgi:trans-aconitate 2-methyltransferase